jgi:peptide/nickel transport system substrate-binding protein
VTAAAAAGTAFALTRGGSGPPPADIPARTATSPASGATAAPGSTTPQGGGIARIPAFARLNFDTFDALRAGEPTVAEVLGRTHSRLIEWADPARAAIGPDLAAAWEQPDLQTLVLRLAPRARWHDRRPVDGRPVTGEDVRAHFQRLIDDRRAGRLSPSLTREFGRLDRVEVSAEGSVVLKTARPDPLLLNALASRFACAQAPEAVEAFEAAWHEARAESVVGSGPFVLTESGGGGLRFEAHRAGHRQPLLDGLVVVQPPGDGAAARERFLDGELDVFLARDRRDAAALRASGAPEASRFEDAVTVTSVFAGAPPWSDARLLLALSGALNRAELARRLHGGAARAAGPVAPAFETFALPEQELAAFPGYSGDPAEDAREARARWEAGGGPGLGPVTIDFPSIYDPLYSASSVVTGMLNESLGGGQFRAAIETYTTISAKAVGRRYGGGAAAAWFGWAPPFDGPDPSRYLVANFHSASPGWEASGLRLPAVDAALDALALEFAIEGRRRLAQDAARLLLGAGGGGLIPWVLQEAPLFRQARYHQADPTPFFAQHLDHTAHLGDEKER